ncbi:excinuclease ABC subunit A [Maritimibacter sp. 55A14]|nr:excinuclease ABC subunit A [Maritimibacter sp. 55A14]
MPFPGPAAADPGIGHCPPGLAKKRPACIPPGQAKRYYRGDFIHDGYIVIRDPGRYGLDPRDSYYRVGDYVYRVDRETREVLDLIGDAVRVLD